MNFTNIILGLLLVLVAAVSGCDRDPPFARVNLLPEADAGEDQTVASSGGTAQVTLDGSGSSDEDGEIRGWRWFSATGGSSAGITVVPAGEDPAWPEDIASPSVVLPDGIWTFSLWVKDDDDAVSLPDTVRITVGTPDPRSDPETAGCVEQVPDAVSEACKTCACTASANCRTGIGACDDECWGLILCVQSHCPDFEAMSQQGDFSCLAANCAEFAGGAAAAMAAAPCVTACDACSGGSR
jgi:hypothetical protein